MEDALEWAVPLFELVDRFDADALAARMAPDGLLISVNDDPVVGPEGMRAAALWFAQAVSSISHEIVHAWRVTYERHDGRKVVLPCTNIFELTPDGLISRYQIFMDMSPVFA